MNYVRWDSGDHRLYKTVVTAVRDKPSSRRVVEDELLGRPARK